MFHMFTTVAGSFDFECMWTRTPPAHLLIIFCFKTTFPVSQFRFWFFGFRPVEVFPQKVCIIVSCILRKIGSSIQSVLVRVAQHAVLVIHLFAASSVTQHSQRQKRANHFLLQQEPRSTGDKMGLTTCRHALYCKVRNMVTVWRYDALAKFEHGLP